MAYEKLLAGADWRLAPANFGGPRIIDGNRPFVACEVGESIDLVLRDEWAALPQHPNLLEAVAKPAPRGVLVRFAAIDWKHAPVGGDARTQLAMWAGQLALAYVLIVKNVPSGQLGRFARPSVHVDLGGAVRIAFLPCAPGRGDEAWPPELTRTWPHAAPYSLVYVIAGAIAGLVGDITRYAGTPLGELVRRCADPRPSVRPPSPIALWRELDAARIGAVGEFRRGPALVGWKSFEDGLGWLAVEQHVRAERAFDNALEHGTQMRLSQVGRMIARTALGEPEVSWKSRAHSPNRCAELTHEARHAWNAVTGRGEWRVDEPGGLVSLGRCRRTRGGARSRARLRRSDRRLPACGRSSRS